MRSRLLTLVLSAAFAMAGSAFAAEAPLTLGEVLDSARERAPQVLEAYAKRRAAEGRARASEGAFDTIFATEAKAGAGGPYDGRFVETTLTRPLGDLGGAAFAGYRVSDGTFAPYQSNYKTDPIGEVTVGAVFSLLRDRAIDDRRFNRLNARLEVAIADMERAMAAVGVQRRAVSAYNQWVAAGLRLKVHKELLALAENRQKGLETQVQAGARPRIILTESQQAILRREALVVRAEQELANAATNLSFFLRGGDGNPLKPAAERLPDSLQTVPLAREAAVLAGKRPDLTLIDLRLQQAIRRLDLERNGRLPRLDLRVEASQGLGNGFPRGFVGNEPELSVGLKFSVPLQQRTADGRTAAATAEIEAARRRRQTLEDQIATDLERLATDVRATAQVETLSRSEADRAAEMAAAERRRFESGAADFFVVNLREEAAADARVRQLDAALRRAEARAELAAAAMDLKALGLDDASGA